MVAPRTKTCIVTVDRAQIYCEIAGKGTPLVMLHAAVADSRQWDNEFTYFAHKYRVLRYDTRGHGKSEPVDGEYTEMRDLSAVLDTLVSRNPVIFLGCSRGGQLALDFTLDHPDRVKALIMVGSGPGGLDIDVEASPKEAEAERAWKDGDLDLTAEIETQIWFDGTGRTMDQVDQKARKLAYEMDRRALGLEARNLGKRLPNTENAAFKRLSELRVPLLAIVGEHDEQYIHLASDYLVKHVPSARKLIIKNAAHLPNMEHPQEFRQIVEDFLNRLP